MTMASSSLPEEKTGWGMGLMQTANFSGSIMGPLLGGLLGTWFGMRMKAIGTYNIQPLRPVVRKNTAIAIRTKAESN